MSRELDEQSKSCQGQNDIQRVTDDENRANSKKLRLENSSEEMNEAASKPDVSGEAVTINLASIPTTTTSSTTIAAQEEGGSDVEESPSVTVYCDSCGKARIMKPDFAAQFDLDNEWTCIKACVKGCAQPDDEVVGIAGDLFGAVLDAAGVKTRKQLAIANVEEFDAGPWAPYLQEWIAQAQSEEITDSMREIVGDEYLLEKLIEAGISTPMDLIQADQEVLIGLTQSSSYEDSDAVPEDIICEWRTKITSLIESHPWMTRET